MKTSSHLVQRTRILSALSATFVVLLSITPVAAQRPSEMIVQGTSFHVFAAPGESTIELLVLGDTQSGMYVVGETTTFLELLALVGGTGSEPRNESVRIERTVRLLREQGGQSVAVYEADADALLTQPGEHPVLQDGDILTVDTEVHNRFNLRDTLSIVSSLASVTLLILRLVDASN